MACNNIAENLEAKVSELEERLKNDADKFSTTYSALGQSNAEKTRLQDQILELNNTVSRLPDEKRVLAADK